MAGEDRTIITRFGARDEISSAFKSMQRQGRRMMRWLRRLRLMVRNVGRSFQRFGRIVKAATAPLRAIVRLASLASGAFAGLAGVASIRIAAGVEERIAEIGTLLGDVSQATLQRLSRDIREAAVQGGQSFENEFRAAYDAISAGVPAQQLTEFLRTANQLAVGGVADVSQAVDVLTSAVNAYGASFRDAERFSDALFTTVRLGKTTITDLASSVGRVAPAAAAVGVSIEELGASIAVLTSSGLSTEEAATRIQASLTQILNLTDAQAAKLKELGVDLSVTGIQTRGYVETLRDLDRAVEGDIEKLSEFVSNVRALQGLTVLARDDARGLRDAMLGMGDAAGATEDAFGRMSQTLGFAFRRLRTTVADVATELGTAFLPLVRDMVDSFQRWFAANRDEVRRWSKTVVANLRFVGSAIGATRDLISTLIDDSLDKALIGETFIELQRIVTTSILAIGKASLKTIGQVLSVIATPIIDGVGQIAVEAARRLWETITNPDAKDIQIQRETLSRLTNLLNAQLEAGRREAASRTLKMMEETRDRLARSEEKFIEQRAASFRRLEEQIGRSVLVAADNLEQSGPRIAAAWDEAGESIGEALDRFRGFAGSSAEFEPAFETFESQIAAARESLDRELFLAREPFERFARFIRDQVGGRVAEIRDQAVQAVDRATDGNPVRRFAEFIRNVLGGAVSSVAAQMQGMQAEAEGLQSQIVAIDPAVLERSAQIVRESSIALMTGVEQRKARTIQAFEEERAAMEQMLREARITTEAFDQWLVNRQLLVQRQLATIQEDAARERQEILERSQRLIRDVEIRSLIGADRELAEIMAVLDDEAAQLHREFEAGRITIEAYRVAVESLQQEGERTRAIYDAGFFGGMQQAAGAAAEQLSNMVEQGRQAFGSLASTISSALGRAFDGVADGTLKVRDAFRDMAEDIVRQIGKIAAKLATIGIIRALFPGFGQVGAQSNFASLFVPQFAEGGVVQSGGARPVLETSRSSYQQVARHFRKPVRRFASGGSTVSRPTFFVAGEGQQTEAIVPLPDGRSIPVTFRGSNAGRGQSSQPINVNISYTVQAIDSQSFESRLVDQADTLAKLTARGIQEKADLRQAIQGVPGR